jgi:bacterioferritin
VTRFDDGVAASVAAGDNGTRDLLEKMLVSEESHVDWLETQLRLIEQLGEQLYLSQQLSD